MNIEEAKGIVAEEGGKIVASGKGVAAMLVKAMFNKRLKTALAFLAKNIPKDELDAFLKSVSHGIAKEVILKADEKTIAKFKAMIIG